ncbi:MAG: glutathione S-transferase N-terminal domain-containing protein [Halothiobacillus sp.]
MLTLYQFESCPFCWKVKALLHFSKIPYTVIEVNPMNSKELEPLGLKKVPVLVDGEKIITESSVIMDYVNEHYTHLGSNDSVAEWRAWVDASLVHFLPPVIHKNFSTSWQTFGSVLKPSGYGVMKRTLVRFAGALAMSRVALKKARERGITDAPRGLTEAVLHWVNAGLAGQAFHGGSAPDLADLSVFGVFRSTDGLAAVALARAASPAFATWYDELKQRTPSSAV